MNSSRSLPYRTYYWLKAVGIRIFGKIVPGVRRVLRFVALPHLFFYQINWQECDRARMRVAFDLLYIFFRLKYFPDHYSLCRLWEKDRDTWHLYYGSIHDAYQRERFIKEVQPPEYQIVFDDKYVCDQMCRAVGLPVPHQHGRVLNSSDCRRLVTDVLASQPETRLILKSVRAERGEGIALAYLQDGRPQVRLGQVDVDLKSFEVSGAWVVQSYLEQHPALAAFATSVNTARIVTLLTRDADIMLLGSFMRFGLGDAYVDNVARGGVAVGIDPQNGTLRNLAYDFAGRTHTHHPSSGICFEGFEIPYWDEVVRLSRRTQRAFDFYKLLALDVALTRDGPVLIEINSAHENVAVEQTCGPLLARDDVLRAFDEYGLLINRYNPVNR